MFLFLLVSDCDNAASVMTAAEVAGAVNEVLAKDQLSDHGTTRDASSKEEAETDSESSGDEVGAMGQRSERDKGTVDEPDTMLKRYAEVAQMGEAFLADGLVLYSVVGDGNCLFRSVSLQVLGSEDFHGDMRRFAVEELRVRGIVVVFLVAATSYPQ